MKEKTRLIVYVSIVLILFGYFGYMCYQEGQRPRTCTCQMYMNHECSK